MNVHTYFKCKGHVYKSNGYYLIRTIFGDSEGEIDVKKIAEMMGDSKLVDEMYDDVIDK